MAASSFSPDLYGAVARRPGVGGDGGRAAHRALGGARCRHRRRGGRRAAAGQRPGAGVRARRPPAPRRRAAGRGGRSSASASPGSSRWRPTATPCCARRRGGSARVVMRPVQAVRRRRPGMSPTFSIVTPVYDTDRSTCWRRASLRSQQQTFERLGARARRRRVTVGRRCAPSGRRRRRRPPGAGRAPRRRTAASWPRRNDALAAGDGEFVAFLDHDDVLADGVLAAVAAAIDADPTIDYLYTDEDHLTLAGTTFLPDVQARLVARAVPLAHVHVPPLGGPPDAGARRRRVPRRLRGLAGLRPRPAGDRAGPPRPPPADHRLPLAHGRRTRRPPTPTPSRTPTSPGVRAVQDHCDRIGIDATVEMLPIPGYHRLVRAVARPPDGRRSSSPTAGASGPGVGRDANVRRRRRCDSVGERGRACRSTSGRRGSTAPLPARRRRGSAVLPRRLRCGVVPSDRPFNFAEPSSNLGAARATGEYLLLLNDDVELDHRRLPRPRCSAWAEDDGRRRRGLPAAVRRRHARSTPATCTAAAPMHAYLGRGADEIGSERSAPRRSRGQSGVIDGVRARAAGRCSTAVGGFSPAVPGQRPRRRLLPEGAPARATASSTRPTPRSTTSSRRPTQRRDADRPRPPRASVGHDELDSRSVPPSRSCSAGRDDWAVPFGRRRVSTVPRVRVVVLNYDGGEMTLRCLDALRRLD